MNESRYEPKLRAAPELQVQQWFNAPKPIQLTDLRGRIVVIEAFQMLCPGCVQFGLPQAQRIAEQFDAEDIMVLGLHTVFEHHEAMTPVALQAFIHEYRLNFPIGVDMPDGNNGIPLTMRAYNMQGTPTLILIDQQGRLRLHKFGHVSDLYVGAAIASLLSEGEEHQRVQEASNKKDETTAPGQCDEEGCRTS